jgi:hypothetical protein
VRGMLRMRMTLRSVLRRRVSRCLSLGPECHVRREQGNRVREMRTAYASGRSDIDFYRRFGGQFIAPQHFDGSIDGADYTVAILCVCRRTVRAVEM